MSFQSGAVSFRRFTVIGNAPKTPTQTELDKLAEHLLKPCDLGMPSPVEYGWSGGKHVLDGSLTFENNVYADCLHFALRIDTNKFPGSLKSAMEKVEISAVAATNPSGFISKAQRRQAKDSVRKQVEEELRTGKFRRTRVVPILWDFTTEQLYCMASSAVAAYLSEIFERTFGLQLAAVNGSSIAGRRCDLSGKTRDFDDLRPTRFVIGPEGDGHMPDYPWTGRGAEAKGFLGNEFLLWLWSKSHNGGASNAATVYIDRQLVVECAYGQTGKDTIKGDAPDRTREAREALKVGKVPRKLGMVLDANRQQYVLTLDGELTVSGARLPDVEDAETERALFEDRIGFIRDLGITIDKLFLAFLLERMSGWGDRTETIRAWINAA